MKLKFGFHENEITQKKGSKRWPYQFKTKLGSFIRVSGPSAYQEALKIGRKFGIKIKKWGAA